MWQFLGKLFSLFAREAVVSTLSQRQPMAGRALTGFNVAKQFLGTSGANDGQSLLPF